MPTFTWPADLPQQVLVAGYQEQFATGNIRSQTARGPAIVRPRTSANVKPWRVSLVLHLWQVDVLEVFYRDTLVKGVWPFWMPHPRKNNMPLLDSVSHQPLTNPDGTPILVAATALMRFAEAPTVVPISPVTWNGSLSLEEMP